jgi:DNA adenine methylase (dam)
MSKQDAGSSSSEEPADGKARAQRPFLKWPGGKRWAASVIATLIEPALRGTYYEPFLGGGAVFFSVHPEKAVLSDINAELISTYKTIRKNPTAVLSELRKLRVSRAEYHRQRRSMNTNSVLRAVRFLYLNRTAFGGIYRLNQKGEFNVPYGGGERTPAPLWQNDLLRKCARRLKGARLIAADFESVIDEAGPKDVCYCDPTYTVAHDNNGFVRYNESVFSWFDQIRLADAADRAAARGATVIVSNAYHSSICELYPRRAVLTLSRSSCVSPLPAARRTVNECLIVLRPRRRA